MLSLLKALASWLSLRALEVFPQIPAWTSTIGGQGTDSSLFQRIYAAFTRNGGIMHWDAATTASLRARGAEGIPYGAGTILLPENPSTSAVYEELIHTAQVRAGITDPLEMEIQAPQDLIRFAEPYNIPAEETTQTMDTLTRLLEQQINQ